MHASKHAAKAAWHKPYIASSLRKKHVGSTLLTKQTATRGKCLLAATAGASRFNMSMVSQYG
jgi:hypothetical protein